MEKDPEMKNLPTVHIDQQARLFDELKLALSRTTSEDMKSWGVASAARLPAIGKRRIRNFSALISTIAKAAGREIQSAVNAAKDLIAGQLAAGASAGIAYHLSVDATLQPAAYKDLPVSMPMEAHQMLFALNAAVEGADAAKRAEKPGEKFVITVSNGFSAFGSGVKALLGSK